MTATAPKQQQQFKSPQPKKTRTSSVEAVPAATKAKAGLEGEQQVRSESNVSSGGNLSANNRPGDAGNPNQSIE